MLEFRTLLKHAGLIVIAIMMTLPFLWMSRSGGREI
jgi:hypothetical protein